MEDGYIKPIRRDIMTECPLCGSKIVPKKNDPLDQIWECTNPSCEARQIDPTIDVYKCTVCGNDFDRISPVDGLPYCIEHMPAYFEGNVGG